MSWHITRLAPLALAASLLLSGCGGAPNSGPADATATPNSASPSQPVASQAPAAPVERPVEAGGPILKLIELNSWYRAALVSREATRNPRDLEAIARPICEGLSVCRVGIWTDQFTMPAAMPVRAPQLEAQEFAFGRTAKGEESALWNCNRYPEFEDEDACLPSVLN